MRAIGSLLLLWLLLASTAPAGQVYRWVDDDGTVHFSDDPPADARKDAESRELAPEDVNSVPVILIGDQRMVGFTKDRFQRLYDDA